MKEIMSISLLFLISIPEYIQALAWSVAQERATELQFNRIVIIVAILL